MDEGIREILDHFKKSWIETLEGYEDLINQQEFDLLIPIYLFIKKLKLAGEDEHFRLGISMQDLIFSRSVESGLRKDRKYIKVKALDNYFEVTLRDSNKMYRQYSVKDLEDERFTGLLQTLRDTLIE